ncbi:MAG: SMP-30/gluconolactonase/LRE family protein [Polyangiaceae bacterium]
MKRLVSSTMLGAVCFFASIGSASALNLDVITTFDPAQGEIPESITTDSAGNLYLSIGSTIRKRAPNGAYSVFGTLPIAAFALGVKVGPDGCVYNTSTSLNPAVVGAFVWRTCTAGNTQLFATLDPLGGPNDLAFDDDGNLYVTDPFLGQVYQVLPNGAVSVWLSDPLLLGNAAAPVLVFHSVGVDGIAFDKHKNNLYFTNLDYGRILKVPFDCGTHGALSVVASDPLLEGADGIAFDNPGTLYVAVNAHDRLVSVSKQGTITVLAEGGDLDGPSSIVFGATQSDKHKMYVTSSAFSRWLGFQTGTPHPALLRANSKQGLPLP